MKVHWELYQKIIHCIFQFKVSHITIGCYLDKIWIAKIPQCWCCDQEDKWVYIYKSDTDDLGVKNRCISKVYIQWK